MDAFNCEQRCARANTRLTVAFNSVERSDVQTIEVTVELRSLVVLRWLERCRDSRDINCRIDVHLFILSCVLVLVVHLGK